MVHVCAPAAAGRMGWASSGAACRRCTTTVRRKRRISAPHQRLAPFPEQHRGMSEANYLGMPDREDSLVSRTTLLIVACYFALTLSMLPWAQRPGPELPGLVPFFVAGVVVTELASSFLLFFSFSAARSWSLLLLASAYLYSGLMPIAHLS